MDDPHDDPWREVRITGERRYDGHVLRLEVDRVRLPDGGETVREVVRHPGAVVIVPVRADGCVLLVRQFRYAVGETLLELPAGTLHPGEDPLDCARRELAEETGRTAARWRPVARFFSAPGFCDEVLHCFLATELAPAVGAHPDEDENIEVVPAPLADAERLIARGEVRDAKSLVGLLLALRLRSA